MKLYLRCCLLLTGLSLNACTHDMSDLDSYIAQVKARRSTAIDPLPQMKPYEPFSYLKQDDRSPFESFELDPEPEALIPDNSNSIRPNFSRNKEPLEFFPLGSLRMQGTLDIANQRYALVLAPDGVVHKIRTGNYIGQNYGNVLEISEIHIAVEEIVPDGFGAYVKRPASIAISDN